MARSQIIKDLVKGEKPLSVSLQELFVLTNELQNRDLNSWVKNELNGYKKAEDIPDYRKKMPVEILYTGINGGFQVKNQPLPIQVFGKHVDDIRVLNAVNSSILELESLKDRNLQIDLTSYAYDVEEETGITCFGIVMRFGKNVSDKILSNVRTKVIEALLLLEKEFGLLDELCIENDKLNEDKIDKVNHDIGTIIFSDGCRY